MTSKKKAVEQIPIPSYGLSSQSAATTNSGNRLVPFGNEAYWGRSAQPQEDNAFGQLPPLPDLRTPDQITKTEKRRMRLNQKYTERQARNEGVVAERRKAWVEAGHDLPPSGKDCVSCEKCVHPYLFGYGGASFGSDLTFFDAPDTVEIEYGAWVLVGGGIGFRSDFIGGSRFELEGFYFNNEFDSLFTNNVFIPQVGPVESDISLTAFMVNFLKEIPIKDCVTAYAGGGIGTGEFVQTNGPDRFSDNVFVFQGIVGLDVAVSDRFSLFTQYKYLNSSPSGFENYDPSNVVGGLRVCF